MEKSILLQLFMEAQSKCPLKTPQTQPNHTTKNSELFQENNNIKQAEKN